MNHHHRRSVSLALLLPLVFSAACAQEASAVGGADDPRPVAVEPSTPAPTDPAPSAAPVLSRYVGEVDLTQWSVSPDAEPRPLSAFGRFAAAEHDRLARECTFTRVGGCELRRCARDAQIDPTAGTVAAVGDLSVEGLRDGSLPFAADRSFYGAPSRSSSQWEGGERVTLRAGGADPGVGAFAVDVVAPSPVVVISPTRSEFDYQRGGDDLGVTWTGGGHGVVRVQLEEIGANDEGLRLRCEAPASQGHLAVPAAAVSAFPATNVSLYVGSVAHGTVATEDLAVTFELRTFAYASLVSVE